MLLLLLLMLLASDVISIVDNDVVPIGLLVVGVVFVADVIVSLPTTGIPDV